VDFSTTPTLCYLDSELVAMENIQAWWYACTVTCTLMAGTNVKRSAPFKLLGQGSRTCDKSLITDFDQLWLWSRIKVQGLLEWLLLVVVSKDEWDTKEGQWRMHCMYSGMANNAFQAEAMSSSEKIKPVTLAIVELHESEGIRQFSQSVEILLNFFL